MPPDRAPYCAGKYNESKDYVHARTGWWDGRKETAAAATGRGQAQPLRVWTESPLGMLMLEAHNHRRKLHEDTPPLEWDMVLATTAQYFADTCPQEHSVPGTEYRAIDVGENLAWGHDSAELASKAWYDEVQRCVSYDQMPGGPGGCTVLFADGMANAQRQLHAR